MRRVMRGKFKTKGGRGTFISARSSSSAGKLIFHVFSALAEFERNLIRERTLAGLRAARARGRNGGRPRKLKPKEVKTIRALLKTNEISVQEIAARFGVSRSTLYRNKLM